MLVRNIHASILRFCSDVAAGKQMSVVNFDAHADETTIPDGDLIGMSGLSWSVDDHFVSIDVLLGISTKDDTNLFRLMEGIGELFERLLPSKRINAYDADTGAVLGKFVVSNGTRALPVSGTTSRPLQYIMVNFQSTLTFKLEE